MQKIPRKREFARTHRSAKVMLVTRELATKFIAAMEGNRTPSRPRIKEFIRLLTIGRMRANTQSIGFDKNGVLRDGQHRLYAIKESGIALQMVVCYGYDIEDFFTIDDGRVRTLGDFFEMYGINLPKSSAAVARRMMIGFAPVTRLDASREEQLEFAKRQEAALAFVNKAMTGAKGTLNQAAVNAVIARAFASGRDTSRLTQFANVLITGTPVHNREDAAAIRLREYLLDPKSLNCGMSQKLFIIYTVAERCLSAFLNRQDVRRNLKGELEGAKSEQFPLL